ncbi:unnamed protein product [Fraxinus pennsylvanica]|uniref:Uncharacterized protein n=1 Tax=Fraxinus pennsylvanica TaxID=56036 RepID=A0AAD1ZRV5_9LAMI|nr:unnamed protein product [Fraxinus pennsylvanica]
MFFLYWLGSKQSMVDASAVTTDGKIEIALEILTSLHLVHRVELPISLLKYLSEVQLSQPELGAKLNLKFKAQRLRYSFKNMLDKYGEAEISIEEITANLMRDTTKDDESELPLIYPPEFECQLSSIFVVADTPLLSVERARELIEERKHQERALLTRMDIVLTNKATFETDFSDSSRRDSTHTREPILQTLGVEYPFPPHLDYVSLSTPPFHIALPTPPLPVQSQFHLHHHAPPPPPPLATKTDVEDQSSSESEMESSDEKERGEVGPKRKHVKQQAILGPAVDKYVANDAVGLKPAALIPKEKPIVKKNSILHVLASTFERLRFKLNQGTLVPHGNCQSLTKRRDYKPDATLEELNLGKLPPEELLSLPMFKNYATGNPASVLYIKNLAKDVAVDDF